MILESFGRLFSDSGCLQIVTCSPAVEHGPKQQTRVQSSKIDTVDELDQHLDAEVDRRLSQCFYVIDREHSWSTLNVSSALFERLTDAYGVDGFISDLLEAFESRVHETHQFRWSSCKMRHASWSGNYELCYRVQFPVANHRGNGDPFSMRQAGIYQKRAASNQTSIFFLFSPTVSMLQRLTETLERSQHPDTRDALLYHLAILSGLGESWDDYIEHLKGKLDQYGLSICYSRIGRSSKFPEADFAVHIKTSQDLEIFQTKMARLVSSLESNIDVIHLCQNQWQHCSSEREAQGDFGSAMVQLRFLERQLAFYQRSITRLAERAQGMSRLLLKILDYRHGEKAQELSLEMNACLAALQDTNVQSGGTLKTLMDHTEALSELQKGRDKDSKTVKALTAISTLYLPASLVASIFNSNLVQLVSQDQTPMRFAAAPQSWIAVLLAAILIVVTYGVFYCLERTYRSAAKRSPWPICFPLSSIKSV